MRRTLHAVGLIGLVTAASLGTAGAASAATATESVSVARASCSPSMRSRAISDNWIPRSPAENDRRLTWEQVRNFDRDKNDRLSDAERRDFHNADISILGGGPNCARPDNPRRR
jgi:hypothetical protein